MTDYGFGRRAAACMNTPLPPCLFVLALLTLLSCDSATAPSTGLNFRLDSLTCLNIGTPALSVQLFVDSLLRAVDTLSIGTLSREITVSPGTHTAFAKEDYVGGYTWPAQTVTVPLGGVVTVVLRC